MNRSKANIWLLDLGIALLGILVMVMVLRLFRFDDPRVFYNAWTYCLAIPTVIISSTMLAHVMIPQHAERSIQTGFLLSVLVHLMLTVAAINTVLFSGLWNDGSQKIEMQLKTMSQGTSFQATPSASDQTVPDYLRPVQQQIDPASQVELRPETQAQKALELLDTPNDPSVDAQKTIQDNQLAEQEVIEPELAAGDTQPIERPDLRSVPMPRAAIEAQAAQQTPLAQDSLPQAKPTSIERTEPRSFDRFERATTAPASEPIATASLAASSAEAQEYRLQREIAGSMQSVDPGPELSPRPPIRNDSIADLPRATSKVPLDRAMSNPSSIGGESTEQKSTEQKSIEQPAIEQLIGNRGQVTRRNPSSSAMPSSVGQGVQYNDPIAGRIASTNAAINPLRSASELPSISDALGSTPGLDRFRPASNPNKAANGLVPIPAPAFMQRSRRIDESSNQELKAMGSLGPKTEESIEKGLEFLAKYQRADGSWKLEDFGQATVIRSDTAATALSLLSFQGAGYSHVQYKYQKECRKALEFLVAGQKTNGDLYRPMEEASDRNGWLYSHAIATLALCEAYGMTQDENLRTGAQRAVDFLVYSQDRQEGGWRYVPRVGSDTSVTGWGMMALKSAELAGLYVPRQTYEGIEKWLEHSQASARERYLYRYNWLANTPETKHGAVPTPVMTSVGLLMRLYTGWKRDNPSMAQGADWLLKRLPSTGTQEAPLRDTYYWYYATQVLFHMGGERWKAWYEALYPMLIETQLTSGPYAGSWEPIGSIPDAWGEYAGRLYVTTMNLLSLEVTYRHLPIYEATSR
ncbi:MAG: prenyltransferase/squalene oxidase repeat-containing protein [Planctomycetota bacterium]